MSRCDPCEFPAPTAPDLTGKCRSAKVVVEDGVSGRFKQTVADGTSGKFVQNASTEECSCPNRLTPSPNVFPISTTTPNLFPPPVTPPIIDNTYTFEVPAEVIATGGSYTIVWEEECRDGMGVLLDSLTRTWVWDGSLVSPTFTFTITCAGGALGIANVRAISTPVYVPPVPGNPPVAPPTVLPDGTVIVPLPDGSTEVTPPDGETVILPPGEVYDPRAVTSVEFQMLDFVDDDVKVEVNGVAVFDPQWNVGWYGGAQYQLFPENPPATVYRSASFTGSQVKIGDTVEMFDFDGWGNGRVRNRGRFTVNFGIEESPQVVTIGFSSRITSGSAAANVATVVTNAPHGLTTGQVLGVAGCTPTAYNRAGVTVTVINATTFSYPILSTPGVITVGGRIEFTSATLRPVPLPPNYFTQGNPAGGPHFFDYYPNGSFVVQANVIGGGSTVSGVLIAGSPITLNWSGTASLGVYFREGTMWNPDGTNTVLGRKFTGDPDFATQVITLPTPGLYVWQARYADNSLLGPGPFTYVQGYIDQWVFLNVT